MENVFVPKSHDFCCYMNVIIHNCYRLIEILLLDCMWKGSKRMEQAAYPESGELCVGPEVVF